MWSDECPYLLWLHDLGMVSLTALLSMSDFKFAFFHYIDCFWNIALLEDGLISLELFNIK